MKCILSGGASEVKEAIHEPEVPARRAANS